ncbi:MAG TPA: 3-keto-5-aminohexanoate cleavage protein [Alphaproteobacteria bacterium]
MNRKTIITCAVTGGADTVGKHPAIPVTPAQIATAAIEACKAGAAIAHIHVRDPETGKPSMENQLYGEVVRRIRESGSPIIINLTTGAGARFYPSDNDPATGDRMTTLTTPARRVEHVLELKPEICSLDMGSFNFGDWVFINTPKHLSQMARAIRAAGVKPELEVFESGQIRLAAKLIADGDIAGPALFQLCLGIPWGAPATPETMLYMRDLLPAGSTWAGFGISSLQFPMVAQAVLLGGHVRVGLEDNLYLERGVFAPSNAALVECAVAVIRAIGGEVATPNEARTILGLAA